MADMSIEVRIPTILRPYTAGERVVSAAGSDVAELISDLEAKFVGLSERLLDGGKLRRFINIYVNDEDVRFLGGLAAPLKSGDSLTILPAVAGGSSSTSS